MLYDYYAIGGMLCHSKKGTTWKNHKYIKKENGRYYYAVDPNDPNKGYESIHPWAEPGALDEKVWERTVDENGDYVFRATDKRRRDTMNLIDWIEYFVDNIKDKTDQKKIAEAEEEVQKILAKNGKK